MPILKPLRPKFLGSRPIGFKPIGKSLAAALFCANAALWLGASGFGPQFVEQAEARDGKGRGGHHDDDSDRWRNDTEAAQRAAAQAARDAEFAAAKEAAAQAVANAAAQSARDAAAQAAKAAADAAAQAAKEAAEQQKQADKSQGGSDRNNKPDEPRPATPTVDSKPTPAATNSGNDGATQPDATPSIVSAPTTATSTNAADPSRRAADPHNSAAPARTLKQLLGGDAKPALRPTATPPPMAPAFEDKTTFKQRELVVSNLGSKALARASELGFKAAPQTLVAALGLTPVQRLTIPSGMSEKDAYNVLQREAPSAYVGANHVYRIYPAAETGDSKATDQVIAFDPDGNNRCTGDKCFGRSMIGWKPDHKSCASRVKIGIIDTSFDVAHPAFAGRKFKQGNFLGEGAISSNDWHGTAVLSLLAGSAKSSTPGLVPDAEFFLASAFKTDNEGNASADTFGILNALAWLAALDVRIVNMSFSGPNDDLIAKAIANMSGTGVTFVAAAGNRGPNGPASYPAAYPDVIAVTAVNRSLKGYVHANSGNYVDVAQPGVDVWTALPGGREGYRTGTSFAAPFFTGILATLPVARAGRQSKAELLGRLSFKDLGSPGRDPVFGQGLAFAPERCTPGPALVAERPAPVESPKMSVGSSSASPSASRPAAAAAAPASAPHAASFGPSGH